MLFKKKKQTRDDYEKSDDDYGYGSDVIGNDMYDDSDPYSDDGVVEGSESVRKEHVSTRFNYKWYEFSVLLIEALLVIYLVLVFAGVAPLL